MLIVFRLPYDDYLINRDVTTLAVAIAQVQNATINPHGVASQAGRPATINVDPLANHFREKVFHRDFLLSDRLLACSITIPGGDLF
jgi:hypothetical protein